VIHQDTADKERGDGEEVLPVFESGSPSAARRRYASWHEGESIYIGHAANEGDEGVNYDRRHRAYSRTDTVYFI
jgi:hypothetical protein